VRQTRTPRHGSCEIIIYAKFWRKQLLLNTPRKFNYRISYACRSFMFVHMSIPRSIIIFSQQKRSCIA
jgi:hypothetical protein